MFVNGREVHVSTLEMRLLVYLVEHRGRVRSREDLLEDVWGYKPGVSTRTIDTHVKRLRDKLAEAGLARRDGARHRLPPVGRVPGRRQGVIGVDSGYGARISDTLIQTPKLK